MKQHFYGWKHNRSLIHNNVIENAWSISYLAKYHTISYILLSNYFVLYTQSLLIEGNESTINIEIYKYLYQLWHILVLRDPEGVNDLIES